MSWFEAMAYARFRGKELPTAFHWYRAAYSLNEFIDSISSAVVTVSNYAGKARRQWVYKGVGPYGTFDMAGNVREWLWTAIGTPGGPRGRIQRAPLPLQPDRSADPWNRSPGNGFRCMRTLNGGPISASLRRPIETHA